MCGFPYLWQVWRAHRKLDKLEVCVYVCLKARPAQTLTIQITLSLIYSQTLHCNQAGRQSGLIRHQILGTYHNISQ